MRILFLATVICIFPVLAWSHPGKTDSMGGHKCYKGCEKWELLFGEYHLHDKDGKPIRVAKKVKKKRRVVEEPPEEPVPAESFETPPPVQTVPSLPVRTVQPEEGISTSPLLLLLLVLLLLLLLIKRRARDRR